MEPCDFVIDSPEEGAASPAHVATGWETVVFTLEDVHEPESTA